MKQSISNLPTSRSLRNLSRCTNYSIINTQTPSLSSLSSLSSISSLSYTHRLFCTRPFSTTATSAAATQVNGHTTDSTNNTSNVSNTSTTHFEELTSSSTSTSTSTSTVTTSSNDYNDISNINNDINNNNGNVHDNVSPPERIISTAELTAAVRDVSATMKEEDLYDNNNGIEVPNIYEEQPQPLHLPLDYRGPSQRMIKNLPDDLKDYYYYLLRDTYDHTTCNIENAISLFPEVYTDDKFYRLEQERVFKKSWICVGHSDQLRNNGDALSITLGDLPIILTNYKGEINAFYNVCRHRGSILLKEGSYKNTTVIRCPYHCWGYGGNGKLLGAPYFNDNKYPLNSREKADKSLVNLPPKITKVKFDKKDYNLFKISVKEWGSMIFINLDKNIHNANKLWNYQIGDLPYEYSNFPFENLKVVCSMDYNVSANWKLIAENFMEYYHLPWVHPELCELSSVANHIRRQGTGHYTGFGTSPLTNGGTPSDVDAFERFNTLNEMEMNSAWFLHLFPNVSLFIYPHHITSLISYPVSPGITKEKLFLLMHKNIDEDDPETAYKIQKLYDFYKLVNEQDIEAVERVQLGISGTNDAYRGGKLTFKFEETIYRFQNILIDYMTGSHMKHIVGDDIQNKLKFTNM